MAAQLPVRQDRNWWGLSAKGSEKDGSRSQKPSVGKLNFVSALGLKSKKPPSLAIQDPSRTRTRSAGTSPSLSPRPQTSPNATRPASKSVSSRDDSLEPRTPVDSKRASVVTHRSLLTLSDSDPFAARSIALPSPSDPNRLSTFSNSSAPEYVSKQHENAMNGRISYASSSSHSTRDSPTTPFSSISEQSSPKGMLFPKRTKQKPSNFYPDETLDDAWESLTAAAAAAQKLTVGSPNHLSDNRLSQPDPPAAQKPHMRARGMTDSSASRPNFLPGEVYMRSSPNGSPTSNLYPVSPRVVVRQASQTRIASPLKGPPSKDLPPPPSLSHDDDDLDFPFSTRYSASSSSISFVSSKSMSLHRARMDSQDYKPRLRDKKSDEAIQFASNKADSNDDLPSSIASHGSPRTLKKALSQQSLRKQPSFSASPSPSPSATTHSDKLEKGPRKQRSFHHPRIPLPPIPTVLRHSTSGGSTASSSREHNGPEPKRVSGSSNGLSSSNRKRLFSGSNLRRPSTASFTPTEDDNRSLFSFNSECDSSVAPASSLHSIFYDELTTAEKKPKETKRLTQEYTPQRIMSPADMYDIEASVMSEASSVHTRMRGQSFSTMATETDEGGLAPPLQALLPVYAKNSSDGALPMGTPSMASHASSRHTSRPSISLEDVTTDHHAPRAVSPPPPMVGLPPPPRPRRSTTSSFSRPTIGSKVYPHNPLSPPPRKPVPPPSRSIEKALHRKSIMRKPSFLEIDDTDVDTDGESDEQHHLRQFSAKSQAHEDSFLDLARESFDTAR